MGDETPEPSMQLLAEAAETQQPVPAANGATVEEDDTRSSSLSDLEDGIATDVSEPNDAEEEDEDEDEDDDEDGAAAAAASEEDTEAETERLEPSPEKHRNRRKVLLSAEPDTSNGSIRELDSAEPPGSARKNKSDAADHGREEDAEDINLQTSDMSSPIDSAEASDHEPTGRMAGRKRKREDDDTTAKSLKKVALELAHHVADSNEAAEEAASPVESASANEEPAMEDDEEGLGDEAQDEEPAEGEQPNEDHQEPMDTVDSNAEEADGDDTGQNAANAAKTQEELEKRKAALETLSSIERDFALLRDKLFADRSNQLAQEMAAIDSDNPSHPLYLSVLGNLNQLREEKVALAKTAFEYKFRSLQKRSVSNRLVVQSQYKQRLRQMRDEYLEQASAEWYQIQRERRNFETETEIPINHFGGDRIQLIAAQTAYNTEVSILSGIGKYVGFPAAPEILGSKSSEIEDDMRKMGISRQPVSTPMLPNPSQARTKPAAEEQFLAETAWANPQHQSSQLLTSIHRNGMRPASPVNTPASQKQTAEPVPNGSASTIPALPTSSLAPTPMSAEALPIKSKSYENDPEPTPSKPPERNQSHNIGSNTKPASNPVETGREGREDGPERSSAVNLGLLDSRLHDGSSPHQNGAASALLSAQPLQEVRPETHLQPQFSQGTNLPPVKVGSV